MNVSAQLNYSHGYFLKFPHTCCLSLSFIRDSKSSMKLRLTLRNEKQTKFCPLHYLQGWKGTWSPWPPPLPPRSATGYGGSDELVRIITMPWHEFIWYSLFSSTSTRKCLFYLYIPVLKSTISTLVSKHITLFSSQHWRPWRIWTLMWKRLLNMTRLLQVPLIFGA